MLSLENIIIRTKTDETSLIVKMNKEYTMMCFNFEATKNFCATYPIINGIMQKMSNPFKNGLLYDFSME